MFRFLSMAVLLALLTGCDSASLPAPTASVRSDAAGESASPTPAPAEQAPPKSDGPEAGAHPAASLIASFSQPPETNGELLILYGQVLDSSGDPLPGAVVEIWQTDASGVYDHPRDSGTSGRDLGFQFYGAAEVDDEGWYAFRTIVPGRYEPRPRHIHFKVKQGDQTLLTSQFYFSDDVAEVADEDMFQAVGASGDLLLLQLVQADDLLLANGQIVVGASDGALPLTPAQGEGPYYPVVSVSDYDNDLVTLP